MKMKVKKKKDFQEKKDVKEKNKKKWMFVAFKSRMTTKGKTKETNTDE